MSREYVKCVFEYNGNLDDLESDSQAYTELSMINVDLENLKWEGHIRDINYGGSLRSRERGEVVPIPVSFELDQEVFRGNLNGIDSEVRPFSLLSADNWEYEVLDKEEYWNDDYERFDSLEGDAVVRTKWDRQIENLESSEAWEVFEGAD